MATNMNEQPQGSDLVNNMIQNDGWEVDLVLIYN